MNKKKAFIPIDPDNVRLYVCGPTIYDRVHLGNARCLLVFDIAYRLLQTLFPRVTYVRNITDIDDKIMKKADEEGVSIDVLTKKTLQWFMEDVRNLGLMDPSVQPRATSFIPEMIVMIHDLIQKGSAYSVKNHVFFDVRSWPLYGSLSRMQPEQMCSGVRVALDALKRDPLDFVLWKPSEPDQEGWVSPWGRGRPGWHIECSAMSTHFLGKVFDLHGGGGDLLFPHHENERAQTCAASGQQECSRYWMHTGMLKVNGKKMSKSLGNFVTLNDALSRTKPEVLFWALMSSHYRHSLDWNDSVLQSAERCVAYIYNALAKTEIQDVKGWSGQKDDLCSAIFDALCQDLNTPKALSELYALAGKVHKNPTNIDLAKKLYNSAYWLGVVQRSSQQWFQGRETLLSLEQIQQLINQRNVARTKGDYRAADRIRHDLEKKNVILEDTPKGTRWRYV